jgi:hypothetical protein
MTATRGPLSSQILKGLDDNEMLFVRAWEKRLTGQKTERRGEGLSWDADGFEPPDHTNAD